MSIAKAERMAALKLDAKRVRLAASVFLEADRGRKINGGCDDLDVPAEFTAADKRSLVRDYHTWNGDPEEAETFEWIGFGCAFGYLSAALLKSAAEQFGTWNDGAAL